MKTIEFILNQPCDLHHKKELQKIAFEYSTDTIFLKDTFDPNQIRLLAFDMDSTLINIECIDEIARQCGKVEEVSKITEASMRGEIKDFSESLIARVSLLKGVPATDLDIVYQDRLQLNPGAKHLIQVAQALGWKTLLVSGGFTFFTSRIKDLLQLDEAHSNTLEIIDGYLTGRVLGAIVDGAAKANFVQLACERLGVLTQAALVMGDGSNDLPMMANAGLSIGYQPKPIVQEKADGTFQFVGLDGVLDLFQAT
ncbi:MULTISPECIES: phosphoserine phosphatase SerB [unclassified Polynucleobacter]|uniref:phosphoserine phosphatase SerB n=1 Tax=unclassified Polynucleobacter TaxID=2640945 RepID=UPI0024919406|nr:MULTISPECIES: phosphoserine phosphatase SerB [unclassified Polynucleobacter]